MKNVKIPVTGKPDNAVAEIADNIITGATGKTELANSPVTLVELGDQRDDVNTAFAEELAARSALFTKRANRRNKAKLLRTSVKRYALYANTVYMGDAMSLAALGLSVVEPAGPVGVLPAPQNLRSFPGQLNQTIDLDWESVRGRESHELQCAESASGPWNEIYRGRKASATCPGLVAGREYFFRVRAYGAGGKAGAWSDITSARAS
jgi:hypothetical protein